MNPFTTFVIYAFDPIRDWLANVCLDRAINVTDRAVAAKVLSRKHRLLTKGDIWHARSVFWSGLNTWSQHRERVRAIKERAARVASVPAGIPVVQYGEG